MSDLRRRVGYLAGLAERYDLAEAGREGKVLSEVIQVLREVALDMDEVLHNQREIEEYVEELDNDLMCLEESLYDEADEDDEPSSRRRRDDEDDESDDADEADFALNDDDDEETYIELECPRCDQPSYYAEHLFNEEGIELSCPHCGYVVFDADADRLVTEEIEEAFESGPEGRGAH
jgi:ribosomal protein S27AE